MKKKYLEPEVEVHVLQAESVICGSFDEVIGGEDLEILPEFDPWSASAPAATDLEIIL